LYDDYLVDVVKKENYKAGNTLKLILPFFVVENIKNGDMIDFSQNNIYSVADSKFLLTYLKEAMNTYIVSTSYGQYIEALCNYINFPFQNTYHTQLDVDGATNFNQSDAKSKTVGVKSPKFIEELKKVEEFRKIILEHGDESEDDFNVLYDIFFNEFPKLEINKYIESVKTVGGKGKQIAVEDIVEKLDLGQGSIIYMGDSITDVEPLQYARDNGGLSVSFNGNDYPLNVAEIAVISNHTIVSSILIDLHSRFDKEYVLDFIREYSQKGPNAAFEDFEVDYSLIEEFEKVFYNKEAPIIEIITDDNRDYLLKLSKEMRNSIRGKDIGGLG
jgi:energy-converting hydrogenase A subunit R